MNPLFCLLIISSGNLFKKRHKFDNNILDFVYADASL